MKAEVGTLSHLPWKVTKEENIWTECYNWIQKNFITTEVHSRYYTVEFLVKNIRLKYYLPYRDTKLQNVLLNGYDWQEVTSLKDLKKKIRLAASSLKPFENNR